LDQCYSDSAHIEDDISIAVEDFELETFTGIKDGLYELGSVIKLIPSLTLDCKSLGDDL
jgi:hypothetical protein